LVNDGLKIAEISTTEHANIREMSIISELADKELFMAGHGLAAYIWLASVAHREGFAVTNAPEVGTTSSELTVWKSFITAGIALTIEPFEKNENFGPDHYAGHVMLTARADLIRPLE
jgi:hypothetical protein